MGNRKAVKPQTAGQNAAELYDIQPYYQRFNQKYNMTRQGLWEETTAELNKSRVANLRKLAQAGHTGYTAQDWAFYVGARANMMNTGFSINCPNSPGNSWESAFKPTAESSMAVAEQMADRYFNKWQGSPEAASQLIRKMGRHFGADLVGFCLLDRRWVFSHWFDEDSRSDYPIKFSDEPGYEDYGQPSQLEDGTQVIPKEMQYVVVFLHDMGEDEIAAAPTLSEMAEVMFTYSKIALITVSMAEFIRGLGYNAIPSANCTALNVPLAIDAGLGQMGRHVKLINPLFGSRCRISKVITDLPLAVDKPIDFGVTEFCSQCKKCAEYCPTGAISFGERSFESVNECNNGGYLQWQVDHKKCYQYWAEVGTNCGICLRVCPFSKGSGKVHDIVRWFIKNLKIVDPFFTKVDDALGYGKYRSPDNLWRKV